MAAPVLRSPKNPHFFQPLLPGFHSHLEIPVKFFSLHIEGRTERNTVELMSDASERIWKVKIEGRRLTVGWKKFVVAHDFRIGDIIVFRHEGDSVFHVTGVGPSFCEIQYLKCNNENSDDDYNVDNQENIRNSSMEQNLKTEVESSLDEDDKDNIAKLPRKKLVPKRNRDSEAKSFIPLDESCFVATITESNLRVDTLFIPKKFARSNDLNKGSNKIILMDERLRAWTLNLKFRESSGQFYMISGWRSFCHENGFKPGDHVTFKLERHSKKTPRLSFSISDSKRVPTEHSGKGKRITGESSQQMSSSSSLSENFHRFVTLIVTPSSLKNHQLTLPMRFIRINAMENAGGKKITLLDKHGVEWPVNLLQKKFGRVFLGSGINEFLKACDLKVHESFVLELVWEDTTPMLKYCSKIKT